MKCLLKYIKKYRVLRVLSFLIAGFGGQGTVEKAHSAGMESQEIKIMLMEDDVTGTGFIIKPMPSIREIRDSPDRFPSKDSQGKDTYFRSVPPHYTPPWKPSNEIWQALNISRFFDPLRVSIEDLPPELLMAAFAFLDNSSLLKAAAACKSWRNLGRDRVLWKDRPLEINLYTLGVNFLKYKNEEIETFYHFPTEFKDYFIKFCPSCIGDIQVLAAADSKHQYHIVSNYMAPLLRAVTYRNFRGFFLRGQLTGEAAYMYNSLSLIDPIDKAMTFLLKSSHLEAFGLENVQGRPEIFYHTFVDIIEAVQDSTLKSVTFRKCSFTGEEQGQEALCNILSNNRTLTHIDLRDNDMTMKEILELLDHCTTPTSLRVLDLRGNGGGGEEERGKCRKKAHELKTTNPNLTLLI